MTRGPWIRQALSWLVLAASLLAITLLSGGHTAKPPSGEFWINFLVYFFVAWAVCNRGFPRLAPRRFRSAEPRRQVDSCRPPCINSA